MQRASPATLKGLLALLVLLLVAAVVVAAWLPVVRYGVTCERRGQVMCLLERDTAGGPQRTPVAHAPEARAVVRVQPVRRGDARVYLYLEDARQAVFAAEFEGRGAAGEAAAAAARLNQALSAPTPAMVRIEASPPASLRWALGGAIGVLALLVIATGRELRRRGG